MNKIWTLNQKKPISTKKRNIYFRVILSITIIYILLWSSCLAHVFFPGFYIHSFLLCFYLVTFLNPMADIFPYAKLFLLFWCFLLLDLYLWFLSFSSQNRLTVGTMPPDPQTFLLVSQRWPSTFGQVRYLNTNTSPRKGRFATASTFQSAWLARHSWAPSF
jgi:hypothetical protein